MERDVDRTISEYVLRELMPGQGPEALAKCGGLIREGVLDSMSILELVGFLENTYGIEMQAQDLDIVNLDNVGDIAQMVRRKLAAKGRPILPAEDRV